MTDRPQRPRAAKTTAAAKKTTAAKKAAPAKKAGGAAAKKTAAAARKAAPTAKTTPATKATSARKATPAKKVTAAPLPPPPVPAAPVVAPTTTQTAAPVPATVPASVPAPAPTAPTRSAEPTPAPATTAGRWDAPTLVTLTGAALVLIGSLLPWARAVTVFGTLDINGTDGDGVLTIICAVVIGLTALGARSRRWVRVLLVLAALLAAFVGIYDLADISHVTGNQYAHISAGPGIWLVAIAALVSLGGAIRLLTRRRSS